MKREDLRDGWYESEEPIRHTMVSELQRIRRRTAVRPWPVLLLATLLTAGIAFKVVSKERLYRAEIVLAMTEGAVIAKGQAGIPFDQLDKYVASVLLPDNKLQELIEKRNLHRLRKKLGMQWALEELRSQTEIEVWKNSFVYYHDSDARAPKSARVGITVIDPDPDVALAVAQDLARIASETHDEHRLEVAAGLAQEVKLMRDSMSKRLSEAEMAITVKQTAVADARRQGKPQLAGALTVDLAALADEAKHLQDQLRLIAQSPEAIADQVTRAGLATSLKQVAERRPNRDEQSTFVLILTIAVIATACLLGAAIFVGSFDTRVHDTDDVARLGLPVLGHVPGFKGDDVGSLEARGAGRAAMQARVPSWLRWRSYR